MAGERTINWGLDATDATYATGDDDANSRFIIVEDLDAGTILYEYDESVPGFVRRGPVDVAGNAINDGSTTVYDGAGTVGDGTTDADHASVSTGSLNGGGPLSDGDGTERQVWVIANGASDPSGADPEDIIFEEES